MWLYWREAFQKAIILILTQAQHDCNLTPVLSLVLNRATAADTVATGDDTFLMVLKEETFPHSSIHLNSG